MKTFLRLLIETFKSLVSFILGISVLSIICYLFMFPAVLKPRPFLQNRVRKSYFTF